MVTYKDYLNVITEESLKQHYDKENRTLSEACDYFKVSQAIFLRVLKYYNFHKSKESHTAQIKKSKLEKYGDANYNNQEQRAKTNIEKYGVDNQFKRQDMMDDIRKANEEKYGSKNNIYKNLKTREENSGSVHESYINQIEKTRQTNLEKYGVDWAAKSDIVKDHIKESVKETFQEKYGCDSYWSSPEAKRSNGSKNSRANLHFEELLKEHNIKYEKEFLLENRYYDFKVNNILIEINPTATHNVDWSPWRVDKGIDKHYHAEKTDLALKNRYRCIHIWDWDDDEKIITTLLSPRESIGARKCNIKIVNKEDEIDFLNKYHFQGYTKSDIALGLYESNTLVMLMTFGKARYSKKHKIELIRLCSCKNIMGGAEKLFKYYIDTYKPESIVSYCDLSKFEGDVYKKLGFKKQGRSISRHWYNIKLNDHITDKLLFKRGFDSLLGNVFGFYGKGSSNERLMLEHGFVEIYDAGQATYIWSNH